MDNSDRLDPKLLNGHSGIQFFIATHTDEKAYQFDTVARAIGNQYNIPLGVEPLKKLYLHSSPIENGVGSKGNARIKHEASEHARYELRDSRTEMHGAMQKVMRANGVAYDQHNVIIFSEDSVQGVPTKIWPQLREMLAPHVNPELLANTQPYTRGGKESAIDGVNYTMLVDYGMIKEAVGTHKFYDMVRQAAWATGYAKNQPVPMIDEVSCYWSRLSDPEGSPKRPKVQSIVPIFLHAPDGLDKPLRKPDSGFVVPKHFQSTREKPDHPISDYFFDHLREESFRRQVFEKLLAEAARPPTVPVAKKFTSAQRDVTARRLRNPFVVQVTPGKRPVPCEGIITAQYIPQNADETAKLLSMEFPGGTKGEPRTADAIIIPPYTPRTTDERLRFLTTVSSMMVSRQIDPRYGRPAAMIVQNLNGCHDWWLNLSYKLTDAGFNGNYMRDLRYERGAKEAVINVPSVTLHSDRYFHILNGANEGNLEKAGRQLLNHCLKNFTRSPHRPGPDSFGETNAVKPADMFSVAAFMTANHESLRLAKLTGALGAMLASNGYAASSGGMDKSPGFQFIDQYKKNGGAHFFASTTNDLVRTETKGAALPGGLDAWIIRRTIGPRADDDLIGKNDAILSLAGGVGTVQEDGQALLRKKPVIFVDPSLQGITSNPWHHSAKAWEMAGLLGKDDVNRMARSHDALADRGILLATSVAEAEDHLRTLKKNPAVRPAPSGGIISALELDPV